MKVKRTNRTSRLRLALTGGVDLSVKRSHHGEPELVEDNRYVKFYLDGAGESGPAFRLSFTRNGSWRLQSTAPGDQDRFPGQKDQDGFLELGASGLLARDLGEEWQDPATELGLTKEGELFRIKANGGLQALLSLQPFRLGFHAAGGQEITAITSADIKGSDIKLAGHLELDEFIYGTGQRFNQVNQRGKLCTILAIDEWCVTEGNSYVPIPFIMSSKGYGLFMDRFERSEFDLGHEQKDSWSISLADTPVDLRIFLAENPQDILRSYASLSGFSPLPAEWLFGIFVSRHGRLQELVSYDNVMEVVGMMDKHDLPWDGMILEGWPTYNTNTYPELAKTVKALHDRGKKVLVYQACGRIDHSSNPESRAQTKKMLGAKNDYLVRSKEDGITLLPETASYNPMDNPYNRFSEYVDLTNPAALDWFLSSVWQKLVCEIGIDGAKIDFCEQFPEHIPLDFSDGRGTSGAHHWYPTLFNALMYRYYNENRPEGGMCFSRGGGIGAQHYPFMWAGDQRREWVFLEAILKSLLSSGLSGIPFMSHDLSGYMPANNLEENPEPEVFIRGTQMGSFALNMQTHGIVTRPYDFAPEIVSLYRTYCEIHQALRPYILEQARLATQTAIPPLRHLYLFDHEDPRTRSIEDQYMLGDALLIAPVLNDKDKRDIYLPAGEWEELFSKTSYQGRQDLKDFPVPFARIPVFINKDSQSATIKDVLAKIRDIIKALA